MKKKMKIQERKKRAFGKMRDSTEKWAVGKNRKKNFAL